MKKKHTHNKLRVVFAGTPSFTLPVAAAVHAGEHRLLACWTQPERPAGRGLKKKRNAVKAWAEQNQVPVYQPSVWDETQVCALGELQADVLLSMSYGLLLPTAALKQTRLGCVSLHPSLLPRWRGAAPIARAIEAGDRQTGLSLMQMTERLDEGAIVKQMPLSLTGLETTHELNQWMGQLAASLCVDFLDHAEAWLQYAQPQLEDGACYARKMNKEESWIDWHTSALDVARKIRAFNAWPVARTLFERQELLIWEARVAQEDYERQKLAACSVGQAIVTENKNLLVACREGALLVSEVQQAGRKRLCSYDFVNGLHGRESLFFHHPAKA